MGKQSQESNLSLPWNFQIIKKRSKEGFSVEKRKGSEKQTDNVICLENYRVNRVIKQMRKSEKLPEYCTTKNKRK